VLEVLILNEAAMVQARMPYVDDLAAIQAALKISEKASMSLVVGHGVFLVAEKGKLKNAIHPAH
jgi:hypothetical protein